MGAQQWFIEEEGIEDGPFTSKQLRELASSGRVVADTPVRHDGMSRFVPARTIKGLTVGVALPVLPVPVASAAVGQTFEDYRPASASASASASESGPAPVASERALDPGAPAESLFENASSSPAAKPARRVAQSGNLINENIAAALLGRRASDGVVTGEPVTAPAWMDLWPLAGLSLVMGWIVGGYGSFGRLYLPGAVLPILVLALGGVPFAFAAIIHYLRPRRIPVGTAIGVALFTAIVGIVMLLVLQFLAQMAAHSHRIPHGRGAIIWGILAAIGTAYDWIHSDSVVQRWFGFVFGVGLCEETAKLLPLVALVLWRSDRAMSVHAFLFVGFASGVGFGVGEALYCYAPWSGNPGLGSNIIRWYSAVPSHAIYTTVCAAFLWKLAERLEASEGWERAGVVAMAAGAMAIVHGTYDTVCSMGITVSLIMETLSFALLIWAVRWVSVDAVEPPDPTPTPWLAALTARRPMYAGLGAAALMLAVSMGLSSSRADALPKIIQAALPPAYRPYVAGVEVKTTAQGVSLSIPIGVRFHFSLADEAVVGTFTNTGEAALHHLVITCSNPEEGDKAIPIGDLEPGATTVIDGRRGWEFAPRESVTLKADEHDPETLTLP